MRTWAEQQLRYIDRFPVNFGCSMLYLNPIRDVCFPSRMLPFIKVAWKVHPLKSVRSFFMDFWVNTAIENGSFMWFTLDLPLKDVNFPVMWKKWHFLRVANSWKFSIWFPRYIMRIPGDILVEQCNILIYHIRATWQKITQNNDIMAPSMLQGRDTWQFQLVKPQVCPPPPL